MPVELRDFAPGGPAFDAGVRVYASAWGRDPVLSRLNIQSHGRYPAWRGLVAFDDGEAVGFVYGTASRRGQWWHDRVAAVLRDDAALTDAWVLTELAVIASHRDRGIGAVLHDAVLDDLPFARAVLSTQVSNDGARRFYARLGWRTVVPGMVFTPGGEPYTILTLDLEEHARRAGAAGRAT